MDHVRAETRQFIDELAGRGFRVWVDGDSLRCSGPAGALDEGLRRRLTSDRDALVAALRVLQPGGPNPPTSHRTGPGPAPDAARSMGPGGRYTLSQLDLLPLARARAGESVYHVPLAIELPGTVDFSALAEAHFLLEDRHEALASSMPEGAQGPVFRPPGTWAGFEDVLYLIAAGAGAEHVLPPEAGRALDGAMARPFDLASGPLWRSSFIQIGAQRTILQWVFHHLVIDGFARDVFLTDLATIYAAVRTGRHHDRRSRGPQASGHAAVEAQFVTGPRAQAAREWWSARFAEPHPPLSLPVSPKACAPASAGPGTADWLRLELTPPLSAVLRAHALAQHIPVAAIALTATVLLVHRITRQEHLLMCTPVANRDDADSIGIIGHLNRVLPVSVALDGASTPSTVAGAIMRDVFAANGHRFLPIGEIAAQPGLARVPLNRLMVAWQERRETVFVLDGIRGHRLEVRRPTTDFDLTLQFEGTKSTIGCRMDWSDQVLSRPGAERFARLLIDMLERIAGPDWDQPIATLPDHAPSPGMVAEVLRAHPGVDDAVVVCDSGHGLMRGWVVLDESTRVAADELRGWLAERLPDPGPELRLMPVATFPRDASGDIDITSLARDDREAAGVRTLVPCATPLQQQIADIWSRVLWLGRPVGPHDDFRSLGGHSLLAVRMLADLEAALGQELPARVLGRLSTVAALAASIEALDGLGPVEQTIPDPLDDETVRQIRAYTASWAGGRATDRSLLVGLNLDGPRVPLFWCLQTDHELQQLARYLGIDQPIYGMRSGHAVMVKAAENIERLAAYYTEEILALWPTGPLFIGGNCQAAVIALQIARQAQDAGREVALLVMHEKMVPQAYSGRIALTFGRDSDRDPYRASDHPHEAFRRYYRGPFTIDIVSGGHGEFFHEPNIQDLVATILRRRDEVPDLAPWAASGSSTPRQATW